MKNCIPILFTSFLLLSSSQCIGETVLQSRQGQTTTIAPDTLTAKQLQADLDILEKSIRTLHPGLERYQSEEVIDANFAELRSRMNRSMTHEGAYLEISRYLAKIKCGHTYANFWNQPDLIQERVIRRDNKVPFAFQLVGKRMLVTKSATKSEKLKKGAEILSINSVPIPVLLDSLITLVKSDGGNDGKRYNDLQLIGFGEHESFDVYQPLLLPPVDGQYEIEFTFSSAQDAEVLVEEAMSRTSRAEEFEKRYGPAPSSLDELWHFEILDEETAYLQLGSFVIWKMEMDWKKFLKDSLKELNEKNIPNLIIDIRGNEGGDGEVNARLANYLLTEDVTVLNYYERIKYLKVGDDIKPYLKTWENDYFDLSGRLVPAEDGMYKRKGNFRPEREYSGSSKAYQGQVFLLSDASNSSATFYLAALMKASGRATIVGTESGGSKKGLNASYLFFLHLPNSKIEVDIPLVASFPAIELPDEGILPDVFVEARVEDIREGVDTQLEKVLELIEMSSQ